MNKYGVRAREHWRRHLPERYQQISDPDRFFSELGEQMQREVIALKRSLAGDDPGGEDYLAKVGRLNMAELMAEEQVMRQMLPPPPDGETPTG